MSDALFPETLRKHLVLWSTVDTKTFRKCNKTINIQNRQKVNGSFLQITVLQKKQYKTQKTVNKYWTTKQLNKGQCIKKKRKQEKLCTQETVPFVVSQMQELLDTNLDLLWTLTYPTFIFNFHPQHLQQWGTNHACTCMTN